MTKLRKYGIIFLVLLMALMCAPMAMAEGTADISTPEALQQAFKDGGSYKLTQNIEISVRIITSKDVVLDLNGFYISTDKSITVGDTVRLSGKPATEKGSAGSLMLNNSSETIGEIKINGNETSEAIEAIGDVTSKDRVDIPSTITINKGVRVISQGYYCVFASGMGATININDGAELQSNLDLDSVPILGNGQAWESGTKINIYGGIITGGAVSGGLAIYHPQEGTLNISGGELKGYDGIQFKSGTLKMTSGTITATGAHVEPVEFGNGSVPTGTAVSFISNVGYTGDMHVNISGNSILKSALSNGLHIGPVGNSTQRVVSVKIDGGSITGEANKKALNFASVEGVSIDITGGIYSSDPTEYVAEGYVAVQDGEMWRVEPKTVTVTPASVDLVLGIKDTETLAASSNVKEGKVFEWASSSGDIVSVDETGKITALKASAEPVTITAALKGTDLKGTCIVTVREAGDVVVTPAEIALNIGGMETLTATCDQGETIRWSSAEEAIATVDEKGNVTGVAKGETDIIATGISSGKSGKCHVVVSEKPVTPPIEPIKPVLPVVSDDVKEEVKPVVGATETDTAEAAAKLDGITEDMLEIDKDEIVAVKADTVVKVVENIATLENVTSADVLPLPVFTAKVESKKTVMISFSLAGADLKAAKPEDVKVLKVLGADSGRLFKYASDITADMDEKFTIQKVDGTIFKGAIEGSETYILSIFIKDGGAFDLDEADGSVADPAAILATKTVEPHHSSSSGCNAGFAGLLLLAAVPFIYRRKR